MQVGDKVRMLKDTIQGVVIRVIDKYQVEIEDDLGFGMPVLIKDLVLVNPMEDKYFGTGDVSNKKTSSTPAVAARAVKASKGLYLSVVEEHKNYAIYLSNNTNGKHFINLQSKKGEEYRSLYFDVLNPKTKVRVSLYPLSDIDSWNSVLVGFQSKSSEFTQFQQVVKKLNLSKLKKSPQPVPLLESSGLVIQLDTEINVDKGGLQNVLNERESSVSDSNALPKPKKEIDLHAKALGIDESAENYVILMGQISAFQKGLESAIANSMPDVTFIHGVGDGKLRTEIHKRIKDYSNVKYFEDANQTRFGYGATKIVLK